MLCYAQEKGEMKIACDPPAYADDTIRFVAFPGLDYRSKLSEKPQLG
jgi:hypothetical protein